MCTVTLQYDGNNAIAKQQLAALLATGLFFQQPAADDEEELPGLDYSDPDLWKEDEILPPLPDTMSIDEARTITKRIVEMEYSLP